MIRSDILQNDLKVEGEFVTEQVMREEWMWSETLIHSLVRSKKKTIHFEAYRYSFGFLTTFLDKTAGCSHLHKDQPRTRIAAVKADCKKSPKTLMRCQHSQTKIKQ